MFPTLTNSNPSVQQTQIIRLRYWALSEIASGVISDVQHAIAVDSAVETIYDAFF